MCNAVILNLLESLLISQYVCGVVAIQCCGIFTIVQQLSLIHISILEEQNRELLLGWMRGDRGVKIPSLRSLGLSPVRITKVNARHMLRSLASVIQMAGYSGLFEIGRAHV